MPEEDRDRNTVQWSPDSNAEESCAPPAAWYTDQGFFDTEVEMIFQKDWLPVGRTDQVANVGDYFTGQLLGNPYVVVRGEDGDLFAHHNVCRHKGCVVASMEDETIHNTGNRFECPYHGWQYDLSGKLKKAPQMGKLKSFAPDQYGLSPISAGQWGPFVFIDMDGPIGGENNPRDLLSDIGLVTDYLNFDQLKFYRRYVYEMNCNWKVFVENSLDSCYHCGYTHCDTIGGNLGNVESHVFDRSSVQIGETKGMDERLGDRVIYAHLFPNLFINRYGSMMDVNIIEPVSVDRCRVIFDFYFEFESFDDWRSKAQMRKQMTASHLVQEEDIEVCEATQRGMNSMSWKWGRYSSINEEPVYAFHALLWREIQSTETS